MKKLNILITLGFSVIALAGCSNALDNNLSSKETLTLQAATTMKLLSATNIKTPLKRNSLTDEEKINILEMIPQIDLLIENGTEFTSVLTNEENIIEGENYTFKEIISFKDNNNQKNTYTLFYKIDSSTTEKEKHDNEIETKETLSGYAKFSNDETLFKFISFTETEQDNDEVEVERTFKIFYNDNSYIQVKEENETEGLESSTEFAYTFVENGNKVLEYSIEIEKEKNKDSIEYELNNEEYEIVRYTNENNETYYKIKMENSKNDYLAIIKKVISEDGFVDYIFIE